MCPLIDSWTTGLSGYSLVGALVQAHDDARPFTLVGVSTSRNSDTNVEDARRRAEKDTSTHKLKMCIDVHVPSATGYTPSCGKASVGVYREGCEPSSVALLDGVRGKEVDDMLSRWCTSFGQACALRFDSARDELAPTTHTLLLFDRDVMPHFEGCSLFEHGDKTWTLVVLDVRAQVPAGILHHLSLAIRGSAYFINALGEKTSVGAENYTSQQG